MSWKKEQECQVQIVFNEKKTKKQPKYETPEDIEELERSIQENPGVCVLSAISPEQMEKALDFGRWSNSEKISVSDYEKRRVTMMDGTNGYYFSPIKAMEAYAKSVNQYCNRNIKIRTILESVRDFNNLSKFWMVLNILDVLPSDEFRDLINIKAFINDNSVFSNKNFKMVSKDNMYSLNAKFIPSYHDYTKVYIAGEIDYSNDKEKYYKFTGEDSAALWSIRFEEPIKLRVDKTLYKLKFIPLREITEIRAGLIIDFFWDICEAKLPLEEIFEKNRFEVIEIQTKTNKQK